MPVAACSVGVASPPPAKRHRAAAAAAAAAVAPPDAAIEPLLQHVAPADRAACRLVCKRWRAVGLGLPLRLTHARVTAGPDPSAFDGAAGWAGSCHAVSSWVLVAEPIPLHLGPASRLAAAIKSATGLRAVDLSRALPRALADDAEEPALTEGGLQLLSEPVPTDGGVQLLEAVGGCRSVSAAALNRNSIEAAGLAALARGCAQRPRQPTLAGWGGGLRRLDLSENNLSKVSAAEALAALLAAPGCRLEGLHLGSCRLGSAAGTIVAAAVGLCATLRWLWLPGNGLGAVGGVALAAALAQGRHGLRLLDLRRNRLSPPAVLALAAVFGSVAGDSSQGNGRCPRPHAAAAVLLDLSGNELGGPAAAAEHCLAAAAALAAAASNGGTVAELRLRRTGLGGAGLAALAAGLRSGPVGGGGGQGAGGRRVASLHRLELQQTQLAAGESVPLAAWLADPAAARLEHLDLGWNELGPADASAWARAIGAADSPLRSLLLNDNPLGPSGVRAAVHSSPITRVPTHAALGAVLR